MCDGVNQLAVAQTDSSSNGLGVEADANVTHNFSNGDSLSVGPDAGYNRALLSLIIVSLSFVLTD